MAGHGTTHVDAGSLWGGKVSPFSASYGKLMMWFFLVSDALTFGGLLVAYGYTRHTTDSAWPIGEETFDSLPFLGHGYPLMYVALMTFILIVSSVTMVLAVEAGHRMDKKGVIKWMIATIIGGFFFLGSQAWEWSHFIHGSHFGSVELNDGSRAIVKGHFGEFESLTVVESGKEFKEGKTISPAGKGHYKMDAEEMFHHFRHAAMNGHVHDNQFTLHDGSVVKWKRHADEHLTLLVKTDGTGKALEKVTKIEGKKAEEAYWGAVNSGKKGRIIYGADLSSNEYGPSQYGQFFFFITGFHGFHVFSGVIINILIFFGVLRGTYHRRGHYEMVEKTGLYWHFVDLVWVFVFTFFYLV
ncbi:MAG TPA: cytochrome c oxidase subunit 3 [Fluviicola sp.]|nr:cytochrome c oxidase subunit 3 [Fluviicola sp.]